MHGVEKRWNAASLGRDTNPGYNFGLECRPVLSATSLLHTLVKAGIRGIWIPRSGFVQRQPLTSPFSQCESPQGMPVQVRK